MVNSITFVTHEFIYEITTATIAGSPIDDNTFFDSLINHKYEYQSNVKNGTLFTKNNSRITVFENIGRIQIQSMDMLEQQSIVSEINDILISNCELDIKKYPLIHQFTAMMTIDNHSNPKSTIGRKFFKPEGNNKLNNIFGMTLNPQSIQFSSGDYFGNESCHIIIEPLRTRSTKFFYVIVRFRGKYDDMKKFQLNFEDKIKDMLQTV